MPSAGIRALATLILAATGLAPAAAQTISISQALLRVHATTHMYATGDKSSDLDLLVSTSGYSQVWEARANSIDPLQLRLYSAKAATASADALATLRAALNAGQIGIQQSCVVDQGFTFQGTVDITWYGRHQRRNDFTVVMSPGPSDLPACPTDVCDILKAIDAYGKALTRLNGIPLLHCPGPPP
jgi:hypothetical protein